MGFFAEIEHHYGEQVHLLDDPLGLSLLAKLCRDVTHQPEVNRLIRTLYHHLAWSVMAAELPKIEREIATRMSAQHGKHALWNGTVIDRTAKVVVLCVARAGIFPAQVCYDFLNDLLNPAGVRQDHLLMARKTNASGQIEGADIQGAKVGGPIEGATLFIPDPMGATGTTIETLLNYYREHVPGTARRVITLNLIITPEYIQRLKEKAPHAKVYAYRLDRGLSDEDVLQTSPGRLWQRERGLDDNGYIVPGAGGLGEVMNNAFV